ncbi:ribosome small subunit-dependent GTPase A [uncultured Thomasclavelia sp.]|uniref:ribosome small subunit-dependent GTPase A n=1 Tax=uncultured Thomasclavelia sp. TaxID=3025759 RepID=UPI0025E8AE50|nr:ribosome small subunit-dependent GTPase A [uncultured Thomasclavelia sp.]
MPEGRIIKALSGYYYVEDNQNVIQCRARGKFRKDEIKPLVGDFVEYQISGSEGYIMKIMPRKNALVRPTIANVDQALIVCSCKEPDFSSVLLDKFLLVIEHHQIEPIIIFSKFDLADEKMISQYYDDYQKAGYRVFKTSSTSNYGIEEIKSIFKDKVTVFTGQSGVGKSSLLNALDVNLNLETNVISKSLGRGKHTTRHVELIKMYGGYLGDTPGFSSLELTMTPQEAAVAYHDFRQLSQSCKFRGCLHDSEPHCAVKQAVADGLITQERYEHYLVNLQEVKKKEERKYG